MKKISQDTENFLSKQFALLFDYFKQSHPLAAGIITTILALLNVCATFGVSSGLLEITPGTPLAIFVYIVTLIWGFLNSSHTTDYLKSQKLEKKEEPEQERIDPAHGITDIYEDAPIPQSGSILYTLDKPK